MLHSSLSDLRRATQRIEDNKNKQKQKNLSKNPSSKKDILLGCPHRSPQIHSILIHSLILRTRHLTSSLGTSPQPISCPAQFSAL